LDATGPEGLSSVRAYPPLTHVTTRPGLASPIRVLTFESLPLVSFIVTSFVVSPFPLNGRNQGGTRHCSLIQHINILSESSYGYDVL